MTSTKRKEPTRIVVAGAGGSTHKTSTAVNLGCALAKRGFSVRENDLDNQADMTQYFNYTQAKYFIGDVLMEQKVFPDPESGELRVPRLREIELPFYRGSEEEQDTLGGRWSDVPEAAEWMKRIKVVPSGIGATGGSIAEAITLMERDAFAAEQFVELFTTRDEGRPDEEIPDVDIFDLHGHFGTLTLFSLRLARKVIAAVTPDDKAIGRHLDEFQKLVQRVGRFNKGLQLDAIVPREKSSNTGAFYGNMLKQLKADPTYGPITAPSIREAVVVPESYWAHEPLLLYVPNHGVASDFDKVAEWCIERGIVG